jgi:hypothetical protein
MIPNRTSGYIVQFIAEKWGLEERQAYNYIRLARKEWQKHFTDVKRWGIGYHLSKRREIRARAIEDRDYRLALDADKDEAKLLGLYVDRQEVGPPGTFEEWAKAVKKEKERRRKENPKSDK